MPIGEVEKTDETVEPDAAADAVILGATGARLRPQIGRATPDLGRWRFASQVSLDVYVGEDELTLKAA